jgi:hypothetical protein
MANDYLTIDQVCEMLGKSASEVKALVADGKLHELRDAGKVFFKRGEVVDVASKEGSSIVDLSAGDEAGADAPGGFGSALKSLADESSGFGVLDQSPLPDEPLELGSGVAEALKGDDSAAIPMAEDATEDVAPSPLGLDEFPEHLPSAPHAGGPELSSEIDLLEDTGITDTIPEPVEKSEPVAEVPDLGLSGSSIISLETGLDEVSTPAPKPAPKPPAKKNDAKPAKVGISVFDDDELDIPSDPMGETRISSGVEDLEPVGSGSGLLDLTQEKDDTSLGAELLDVISPTDAGETETEAVIEAGETVSETGGTMLETDMSDEPVAAVAGKAAAPKAPRPVSETPGSVPLNVCLVLGILGLAIAGLGTAAQLQGVWPSFLSMFAKSIMHYSVFGGLLLIALVSGVFGILAGRK